MAARGADNGRFGVNFATDHAGYRQSQAAGDGIGRLSRTFGSAGCEGKPNTTTVTTTLLLQILLTIIAGIIGIDIGKMAYSGLA
jgi:hypothetical protein